MADEQSKPQLNARIDSNSIDERAIDSDFRELGNLHIVDECRRLLNMKVNEETTENMEIRVRVAEQALECALETHEASRIRISLECLRLFGTKIIGETIDNFLPRFEFLVRINYLALETPDEKQIRLSHRHGKDLLFFSISIYKWLR